MKHEKSETFHYELPSLPAKGAYHFGNSQGFQYEATEVRRCLTSGAVVVAVVVCTKWEQMLQAN